MLPRKPTRLELRQEDVEELEALRKEAVGKQDEPSGSMRAPSAKERVHERIGLQKKK